MQPIRNSLGPDLLRCLTYHNLQYWYFIQGYAVRYARISTHPFAIRGYSEGVPGYSNRQKRQEKLVEEKTGENGRNGEEGEN